MQQIQNVLNELLEVKGVRQVQALDKETRQLSKAVHKDYDYIDIFEIFKKIKEFSFNVIEKTFKKTGLKNIFLSIENIDLSFYFFKNDISLIIISEAGTNLGKIRLIIRKNEEILSK